MEIGGTLLIVLILVVAIWVLVEIKRFKHKTFAILLIILIIFTYFSFVATIKGRDIDFKSMQGIKEAGKLYVSWLVSVFGNLKTLTANAIDMNWVADKNETNQTLPQK
jgi:glucan phosphoethanolaminetransferase (alkaline phosphatase superfamily)